MPPAVPLPMAQHRVADEHAKPDIKAVPAATNVLTGLGLPFESVTAPLVVTTFWPIRVKPSITHSLVLGHAIPTNCFRLGRGTGVPGTPVEELIGTRLVEPTPATP
jgi:hypothetical protein